MAPIIMNIDDLQFARWKSIISEGILQSLYLVLIFRRSFHLVSTIITASQNVSCYYVRGAILTIKSYM